MLTVTILGVAAVCAQQQGRKFMPQVYRMRLQCQRRRSRPAWQHSTAQHSVRSMTHAQDTVENASLLAVRRLNRGINPFDNSSKCSGAREDLDECPANEALRLLCAARFCKRCHVLSTRTLRNNHALRRSYYPDNMANVGGAAVDWCCPVMQAQACNRLHTVSCSSVAEGALLVSSRIQYLNDKEL